MTSSSADSIQQHRTMQPLDDLVAHCGFACGRGCGLQLFARKISRRLALHPAYLMLCHQPRQ